MRALSRVDGTNEYQVFVRDAAGAAAQFPALRGFSFREVWPSSIWFRHPIGFPIALRRCRPDVLHVQYFVPPLMRCPVVVTVHDVSFAVRPEYFSRRDRLMLGALVGPSLRRAAWVITDTQYTRADLVATYELDPARIAVIPLAADPRYRPLDPDECLAAVSARHGLPGPFILYVGTLQPRKNVANLVRSYGMLRRRTGLPHKLLIAGKPKYMFEDVFLAIEQCGYADDVVFAGFVPDEDLPLYYSAAAAFAFPSRYEGFGLPVLEAMACGTPVVCSNASCLPEVAGDAALLADPERPEEFCEALQRVLTDPSLAGSLRQRGLCRAAEFSWDRTARETLEIYRRAAGEAE